MIQVSQHNREIKTFENLDGIYLVARYHRVANFRFLTQSLCGFVSCDVFKRSLKLFFAFYMEVGFLHVKLNIKVFLGQSDFSRCHRGHVFIR